MFKLTTFTKPKVNPVTKGSQSLTLKRKKHKRILPHQVCSTPKIISGYAAK